MLKKNRSSPNSAVIPVLYYPDARAAVEWLTTALPFTIRLRNSDTRCQLVHGDGAIIVTQPGVHADAAPSTEQSPGAHYITLRVTAVDELFKRAEAAGARVLAEPDDHMYGERQCAFLDPWGHAWTLSETIFDSDPADWAVNSWPSRCARSGKAEQCSTGRLTGRCSQRPYGVAF